MSRLHQLPNVLILHLKRFEFDAVSNRYKKLTNPVTFPGTLDLDPYCTTDPVSVVSSHKREKGGGRGDNGVIVTSDLNVDCSVVDVRSEIRHIQQHRPQAASPPSSPEDSRSHSRLSPSSSPTFPASSPDTPSGEEDHHRRRPTYNRTRTDDVHDVEDAVVTVTDDSLPSITCPTSTNTHTNTSTQRSSMGTCYKLTSVVHHLGSQPFIGHYTCDTIAPARYTTSTTSAVADTTTNGNSYDSSKGPTWQHCNDTMISSITEVRRMLSYVIYYASSLM